METSQLVLEYLKVLLSAPVLLSIILILAIILFREDIKALLLRTAKIRFPGGAEFSTSQTDQFDKEESRPNPNSSATDKIPVLGIPEDLNSEQKETVENLLRSHIANSYIMGVSIP